jgi:hypothetical protein
MNPRIQELWDEAAKSTTTFPSGQNNSWETQVNFMEKFAELIVRECADIARLNTRVDSKVYLMIQEHFGVEE